MKEKLLEQTIATNRAFKRLVDAERAASDARTKVGEADHQVNLAKAAFEAENKIHVAMIKELPIEDLESAWQQFMRT